MSEKNMLGGSLAEVAGLLKDFAEKLGGKEGEQWLAAFKRFLRKEEPWPLFPIWKIIKLGTGIKTVEDFQNLLREAKYQIDDWASDIMSQPAFAESLIGADPEEEYDLVLLNTTQLVGKKGGTIAEIFANAERLGFKKCPAWMGPKLRLVYSDQRNHESILVAIEPIADSKGVLRVFDVGRRDSILWFQTPWGFPDHSLGPGFLLVFVRPRK